MIPLPPYANSCKLFFPTNTAPACRKRRTISASSDGTRFSCNALADVVRTPAVSIRSLSAMGIPCSGPRHIPRTISSSAARASASADSSVTVIKALSDGFSFSMCPRHSRVISTGDISFLRKRGPSSEILDGMLIGSASHCIGNLRVPLCPLWFWSWGFFCSGFSQPSYNKNSFPGGLKNHGRDDDRACCDTRFLCGRPVATGRRSRRDSCPVRRQSHRPCHPRAQRARRSCHRRRRKSLRYNTPPPSLRAPTRASPDFCVHGRAQRRVCPHPSTRSGQADQSRSNRSRPRHLYLQRCSGREHPHLRRVPSPRLARVHGWTMGYSSSFSDWTHRRDYAV